METSYQDINAKTIDRWVKEGWEWGMPIQHEDYLAALKGTWEMLLTPTKPVPHSWIGEVRGKKVLGLASGGWTADADFCRTWRKLYGIRLFDTTA